MKLKKDPNFQAAQVSLAHKHFSFFPPKPENEEKNMRKSAVFHLILSIASSDKNKKKGNFKATGSSLHPTRAN